VLFHHLDDGEIRADDPTEEHKIGNGAKPRALASVVYGFAEGLAPGDDARMQPAEAPESVARFEGSGASTMITNRPAFTSST
jgi:hypothetical protein